MVILVVLIGTVTSVLGATDKEDPVFSDVYDLFVKEQVLAMRLLVLLKKDKYLQSLRKKMVGVN